jgi:hypothetical protein
MADAMQLTHFLTLHKQAQRPTHTLHTHTLVPLAQRHETIQSVTFKRVAQTKTRPKRR